MTADAGRRAGVTGQAGRPAETAGGERPRARRLLDAAEQVFGERTYRGSTVADICARAGIATGSFYAHFDSKAEIFTAVVRRLSADARAAFRAFFDVLSRRPWIYRIVREAEFVIPGLFQEYHESLARGYARGVRRAQLKGEIDPHYDPEVIAYIYSGIGYTIGMRWAEWTAGRQVPGDVLDDMLDVLARGLPPR